MRLVGRDNCPGGVGGPRCLVQLWRGRGGGDVPLLKTKKKKKNKTQQKKKKKKTTQHKKTHRFYRTLLILRVLRTKSFSKNLWKSGGPLPQLSQYLPKAVRHAIEIRDQIPGRKGINKTD